MGGGSESTCDRLRKCIGAGGAFQDALRTIITTTKEPLPPTPGQPVPSGESPLIMIGHSMGALMLEGDC